MLQPPSRGSGAGKSRDADRSDRERLTAAEPARSTDDTPALPRAEPARPCCLRFLNAMRYVGMLGSLAICALGIVALTTLGSSSSDSSDGADVTGEPLNLHTTTGAAWCLFVFILILLAVVLFLSWCGCPCTLMNCGFLTSWFWLGAILITLSVGMYVALSYTARFHGVTWAFALCASLVAVGGFFMVAGPCGGQWYVRTQEDKAARTVF